MNVTTAGVLAGTDAMHRDGQYTSVAKWFHWVTLPLIAIALPVGFVIDYIAREPIATKHLFISVHMSAGLTILFVTIARLGWRIAHPPPPLPEHVPPPLRLAANTVHWLLYAALIVQPVLGFALANAMGYGMEEEFAYLGFINIPAVIGEDEALMETLQQMHRWVGYAIAALLVAHIGGAVYHHAIRRDGVLMRML
jgi:cytochrome b561